MAVLGVLSLLLLVAFGASRVGGAPDSPVAASPSARAGRSSPPPRASGQAAPTPGPSRSAGATTQAPAPSVGKVACLPADKASEQVAVSNDRVVSGGLSMPVQGAPWDEPFNALAGIPLVSAGALQSVKVADYKDGGWAAALMVGRMRDDVGASTPQAAAALMASCLEKTQYTVAAMSRRDTVNRAVTVDGRPGWTVEADLTLNDPDLTVSHELMVVTVVQTSPGVLGVFYASIPATTPDYTGLARATQKALRVVEVTGSV